MYQEKIYRLPVSMEDFRNEQNLLEDLKRCTCGNPTFLDTACALCGSTKRKPFFQAVNRYKFLTYSIGVIAIPLLVSMVLAGIFLHPFVSVILFIAMAVMVGVNLVRFLKLDGDSMDVYWKLHQLNKKTIRRYAMGDAQMRAVESEVQEELMDAYYNDLNQLEQRAFVLSHTAEATREDWIAVLNEIRSLALIFSNARISRLQFRIMMHLNPQDPILVNLNDVCVFLTTSDIPKEKYWEAQHFLGDYLLLAQYVECGDIKRMFDALTFSIMATRKHMFGTCQRIKDEQEALHQLLQICGADEFRKAWPNLEKIVTAGKVVVPNDADAMIRLADQLLVYCYEHHNALIGSGDWIKLIHLTGSLDHPAMQELSKGIEKRFAIGWMEKLSSRTQSEMADYMPRGFGNIYRSWSAGTYGSVKDSVFTMLLPEEMIYVSQIWNHCVYNAFGTCYTEIGSYGIRTLLSILGRNSEIHDRLVSAWKETYAILERKYSYMRAEYAQESEGGGE